MATVTPSVERHAPVRMRGLREPGGAGAAGGDGREREQDGRARLPAGDAGAGRVEDERLAEGEQQVPAEAGGGERLVARARDPAPQQRGEAGARDRVGGQHGQAVEHGGERDVREHDPQRPGR